jgi:putative endonuclease
MRRRSHRDAERYGRRSEWLCAWLLRLKGYRILERHWKCASGEIDLIVRRGRLIAFVEVKARGDWASAAEAVGRRQQLRIARAASQFLATRAELQSLDQRFDVMLVVPGRLPLHVRSAWLEAS